MKKISLFLALAILSLSVSLNGCGTKEKNVSESDSSLSANSGVKTGNTSESEVLIQAAFDSFKKGDFSAAIEQYSHIVAIDPKNVAAYGGLGNCYYRQGDIPQALEYFNKVLAMDPKSSSALCGLGNCYLLTDSMKSKEYYKKAIAANAQNPWGYFDLGLLYSGEKNKADALQQAKILASLDKDLEDRLKKQIAIDNP